MECAAYRVEYYGEVNYAHILKLKAVKINPGSFDEQLVADWIEMVLYALKTLDHLNEHMRKYGRPKVGRRAVYGC